ncbi:MAG: transcription termination/antitermination protein NusA, partial [Actinomycetes bacterium]
DQLSLAIGKRGQNVRLAARLTGWHIEIKSESDYAQDAVDSETSDDETQVRCAAVLSNGRRCPNAPIEGSRYCGLEAHQALEGTEQAEPVEEPMSEPERAGEPTNETQVDEESVTEVTSEAPVDEFVAGDEGAATGADEPGERADDGEPESDLQGED